VNAEYENSYFVGSAGSAKFGAMPEKNAGGWIDAKTGTIGHGLGLVGGEMLS
jgi:hypothetical protein